MKVEGEETWTGAESEDPPHFHFREFGMAGRHASVSMMLARDPRYDKALKHLSMAQPVGEDP